MELPECCLFVRESVFAVREGNRSNPLTRERGNIEGIYGNPRGKRKKKIAAEEEHKVDKVGT